jgi:DNA-binding XRE family transcriptional regulator
MSKDINIKNPAELARLLEAAREHHDMSKRQLAALAEVSLATYAVAIAKNKIGNVPTLFKYLDALGLQMKIGPKA